MNKQKKQIFWSAALVGIVGGSIGNFWVGSYFNMFSQNFGFFSILIFGLFSLFFVIVIFLVFRIINKINNIKKERPKKKK